MPIETTITVYKTSEKMPERWKTVLVAGGVAVWTGTEWRSRTGVPDERPIAWQVQWWADAPDELEIASKLSPAPVKPDEDQFRLRTHAALYRAACGLCERLGARGDIHCDCKIHEARHRREPKIAFELWFFPRSGESIGVYDEDDTDPQLVYDEFERLMRARFAPAEPVPAGIEACDGAEISKEKT